MAHRLEHNDTSPSAPVARRFELNGTSPSVAMAHRFEQNGTETSVPPTPALSRRVSRRSGIVNVEDKRLQKQLSSARQNGSVEWDFGSSNLSSTETLSMPDSPPSPTLIKRPVELTQSLPSSPALRHPGSQPSIKKSSKLTHSISFAQADKIYEVPSRARVWTEGYSNSLATGMDNEDVNHGGGTGRKKSIYSNTNIPIQHALRFQTRNSRSLPEIHSRLIMANSDDESDLPGPEPEDQLRVDVPGSQEDKKRPENGNAVGVDASKKRPPPLLMPDSKAEMDRKTASLSSLWRVASRSSISSTLDVVKDKIVLAMPTEVKNKPEEVKLRAFVAILFLICLGIIIATHVIYQQHIGELRLFQHFRFEDAKRKIVLYDKDDLELMQASVGVTFPKHLHPHKCKPNDTTMKERGKIHGVQSSLSGKCLEWKDHARLEIFKLETNKSTNCYRLMWRALKEHTTPMDCWPVGGEDGHWYGGGESLTSKWPLDNGLIKLSPFVTGDEDKTEWGNVIKKFFINSRGLSITVEDDTPLFVSLNDKQPGLCLQAAFDDFTYYYHRFNLPRLNYTVCTEAGLGNIFSSHLTAFWEGHTDADMEVLYSLLERPLWQVPGPPAGQTYSHQLIQDYLTQFPNIGNRSRGYLLLDHHWQQNMGDLSFGNHFQGENLTKLKQIVADSGLKLALTVNPFVSTDSPSFKVGVEKDLFVKERNSTNVVPAITWFKDVPVAALLDITNNETVSWLKEKLRDLASGVNADLVFFLETGNTFHTPHYFKFHAELSNPDLYKTKFIDHCMDVVNVIGVSGASSTRPKAPAFIHMSPLASTWSNLRTIVPNILHLGVIGYPFINPGPVGGLGGNSSTGLPEEELFIRWWQLATFLPQLHFLNPPSAYSDKDSLINVSPVKKRLADLRTKKVNPALKLLADEAMEKSKPVVRPLWMLDPSDPISQRIDDEFMVGDKILVAPVLHKGQRTRNIYLPSTKHGDGVWIRGTDGKFWRGGQWLNNTRVELDEVMWFERRGEGDRPGVGHRSSLT